MNYYWKILVITICGNFLPELTPLSICWFVLENSTRSYFSHDSRSFSSSHYIVTLVTNREQYDKDLKLETRRTKVVPLLNALRTRFTPFFMLIKILYAKPGNRLKKYGFRRYALHKSSCEALTKCHILH